MKQIVSVVTIVFATALLLSGCVSTAKFHEKPKIVDISDSKVVVRVESKRFKPGFVKTHLTNTVSFDEVKEIANDGCANYAAKTEKSALYLSETKIDLVPWPLKNYCVPDEAEGYCLVESINHLFACRDKAEKYD